MKTLSLLTAAILLLAGQAAHAVTTTYSDQATWQVALGGGLYAVTFDGLTSADPLSYNGTDTFDAGPFTMSSDGEDQPSPSVSFNRIEVNPTATNSIDGSPVAQSRINSDATAVSIDFDLPVYAFGADFRRISDDGTMVITLDIVGGGSETVAIPTIGNTTEFFGFVSDPPVAYSSLSFSNTGMQDFLVMDNLSAATIPEPASGGLLGLALCCSVIRRRR